MRNPYDVLGLKRDASAGDIRKAFRKLAKQLHPDVKPGDKAAEAKFKEVNAAYGILGDEAKRVRFDRGEIDAEGNEVFTRAYANAGAHGAGFDPFRGRTHGGAEFHYGFGGGGQPNDFSDLFAHMFREQYESPQAKPRGRDLRHTLAVDFLDAVNGSKRRITLGGGRTLDVTIPAGVEDGQVLRLKGQGEAVLGGESGDLLLEIKVLPHKLFRRTGNDIQLDVPVTLAEAVLGAKITVPTPSGLVTLAVPAGSNTGSVLRLRGKGVNGGDQYVTLKVTLPERVDQDLASFIKDWSERHPYDPRAGM